MKLNEMITEAIKQDVASGEMAAIWDKIRETESSVAPPRRHTFKVLLIAAAIVCLLCTTLSAAASLSGFEWIFGRLDGGSVEIVSSQLSNHEVEWKINEVWFDEYNIFIGGTLITAEPLKDNHSYSARCRINLLGESEHRYGEVQIDANGTNKSAFFISCRAEKIYSENYRELLIPNGLSGSGITLQLHFDELLDWTRIQEEIQPDANGDYIYKKKDFLVSPGEWVYTAQMSSGDQNKLLLQDEFAGIDTNGISFTVDSVEITSFTVKINGKDMIYSILKTTEVGWVPVKSNDTDAQFLVWIKMKDGTLLGKGCGVLAQTEKHHIFMSSSSPEQYILCFDTPIDVSQVESLLLVQDWGFTAEGTTYHEPSYANEPGYTAFSSPDDSDHIESWFVACEIPLP